MFVGHNWKWQSILIIVLLLILLGACTQPTNSSEAFGSPQPTTYSNPFVTGSATQTVIALFPAPQSTANPSLFIADFATQTAIARHPTPNAFATPQTTTQAKLFPVIKTATAQAANMKATLDPLLSTEMAEGLLRPSQTPLANLFPSSPGRTTASQPVSVAVDPAMWMVFAMAVLYAGFFLATQALDTIPESEFDWRAVLLFPFSVKLSREQYLQGHINQSLEQMHNVLLRGLLLKVLKPNSRPIKTEEPLDGPKKQTIVTTNQKLTAILCLGVLLSAEFLLLDLISLNGITARAMAMFSERGGANFFYMPIIFILIFGLFTMVTILFSKAWMFLGVYFGILWDDLLKDEPISEKDEPTNINRDHSWGKYWQAILLSWGMLALFPSIGLILETNLGGKVLWLGAWVIGVGWIWQRMSRAAELEPLTTLKEACQSIIWDLRIKLDNFIHDTYLRDGSSFPVISKSTFWVTVFFILMGVLALLKEGIPPFLDTFRYFADKSFFLATIYGMDDYFPLHFLVNQIHLPATLSLGAFEGGAEIILTLPAIVKSTGFLTWFVFLVFTLFLIWLFRAIVRANWTVRSWVIREKLPQEKIPLLDYLAINLSLFLFWRAIFASSLENVTFTTLIPVLDGILIATAVFYFGGYLVFSLRSSMVYQRSLSFLKNVQSIVLEPVALGITLLLEPLIATIDLGISAFLFLISAALNIVAFEPMGLYWLIPGLKTYLPFIDSLNTLAVNADAMAQSNEFLAFLAHTFPWDGVTFYFGRLIILLIFLIGFGLVLSRSNWVDNTKGELSNNGYIVVSFFVSGLLIVGFYINCFLFVKNMLLAEAFAQWADLPTGTIFSAISAILMLSILWVSYLSLISIFGGEIPNWRFSVSIVYSYVILNLKLIYWSLTALAALFGWVISQRLAGSQWDKQLVKLFPFLEKLSLISRTGFNILAFLCAPGHFQITLSMLFPQDLSSSNTEPRFGKKTFSAGKAIVGRFSEVNLVVYGLIVYLGILVFYTVPPLWIKVTNLFLQTGTAIGTGAITIWQIFWTQTGYFFGTILLAALLALVWCALQLVYFHPDRSFAATWAHQFRIRFERLLFVIFTSQGLYLVQIFLFSIGIQLLVKFIFLSPQIVANIFFGIYWFNIFLFFILAWIVATPIAPGDISISQIWQTLRDVCITGIRILFSLPKRLKNLHQENFSTDFEAWLIVIVIVQLLAMSFGSLAYSIWGRQAGLDLKSHIADWAYHAFIFFYLGWFISLPFNASLYRFYFPVMDWMQALLNLFESSAKPKSIIAKAWASLRTIFLPVYTLYPGYRSITQASWIFFVLAYGLIGIVAHPLEIFLGKMIASAPLYQAMEVAAVLLLGSVLSSRVTRSIPFISILAGILGFWAIRGWNLSIIWLCLIPFGFSAVGLLRLSMSDDLAAFLDSLKQSLATLNRLDQKWGFQESVFHKLDKPYARFSALDKKSYGKGLTGILREARKSGYPHNQLFNSMVDDPFYQAHLLWKTISTGKEGSFFDFLFSSRLKSSDYLDKLRRAMIYLELAGETLPIGTTTSQPSFAERTLSLVLRFRRTRNLSNIPFDNSDLTNSDSLLSLPKPIYVARVLHGMAGKVISRSMIASTPDIFLTVTTQSDFTKEQTPSQTVLGTALDIYLNEPEAVDINSLIRDVIASQQALNNGELLSETVRAVNEMRIIYKYLSSAEQAASVLDILDLSEIELPFGRIHFMKDLEPILYQIKKVIDAIGETEELLRENRLRPTLAIIDQLRQFNELLDQVYPPERKIIIEIVRNWMAILSNVATELTETITLGEAHLELTLISDHVYWEDKESISFQILNIGQSAAFSLEVELVPVQNCHLVGSSNTVRIRYLPGNRQREVVEFLLGFSERAQAVVKINFSYTDGLQNNHTASQEFNIYYASQDDKFVNLKDFSRSSNPYRAGLGMPVRDVNEFYGRREILSEIQRILSDVDHPHAIMLYGQRRMGKTSIVKQVEQIAQREKIFVPVDASLEKFHFDRLKDDGTAGLVHDLAYLIWLSLPDRSSFPRPKLDDFKGNPAIKFNGEFIPRVNEFLANENRPRHLLLLLDEFDRLQQSKMNGYNHTGDTEKEAMEAFLHILRDYAMNMQSGGLIIVGTHRLLEMAASYRAALFNIFTPINVSYFDEQVAKQLITEMATNTLIYDLASVDKISRLSGRHPYYLRLLCAEVFEHCAALKKHYAGLSIFDDKLMDNFQEHITPVALDLWNGLTPAQKYVIAMFSRIAIHENEMVSISEIRKELRGARLRILPDQIEQSLETLHQTEILERIGDQYRFHIDLFRIWLRENKPLNAVRVEVGALPTQPSKSGDTYEP